ncbi:MAG: glycosyltransferase family 2 protein [Candidatus Binatia bacterium]
MSVAIVVLNWNKRAATLECVQSLHRQAYSQWSLVLVDNGCAEFSAAEVESLAPGGTYLHSPTNLGFAGGSNLGMRAALSRGADWIWFLNNDALPEPDALDVLLATAQRPARPALIGAKILQRARPERLDSAGLDIDLARGRLRLVGHDEIDHGQYDLCTDPVAVPACALLVSRVAAEYLDGFDDIFFAYMEDADLCLRARAAGFSVAFAPAARVLHDRAPATQNRQSLDSLYYSTRNHLLLLQRHSPSAAWERKVQELSVQARCAAYALRAGTGQPRAALSAVRQGIADYRRGRAGRRP